MAAAIAEAELVQGAGDSWELDLSEEAAFISTTVNVGFFFEERAPVALLKESLVKILPTFAPIAGRLTKREGTTIVLCNDAGVPLMHQVWDTPAPSSDALLAEDVFDNIRDHMPTEEGAVGDAVCRIKVNDFVDGQLVGLSFCHGLGDARSIGMMIEAWSAAFRGEEVPPATHDRSVRPPSPKMGEPPLVSSEDVPEAWKGLHHPLVKPDFPAYEPKIGTYRRSAEQCAQLKEKYAASTPGMSFSANDVLVGEIAELAERCEASIFLNWRDTLGHPHLFGNALGGLTVIADTACDVPKALRGAVQSMRDPACLRWYIAQGQGKFSDLLCNNWGRFLAFERVSFASPLKDVNLGASMMESRGKIFGPMGLRYIMMVPQPDGMKGFVAGDANLVDKLCAE